MHKYLLTIILILCSFSHAETYTVGKKKIKIPGPDAQLNYLGENENIDRGLIKAAKTSNNRVLAVFCSKQDYAEIIQGKLTAPNSNYSLQVDTRFEAIIFTDKDFQEFKKEFKEAYNSQEIVKKLAKDTEVEIIQKIEEIFGVNTSLTAIPSGIVSITQNSITHSAFMKTDFGGDKKIAYVLATKIWIDGKIIDLHHTVYGPENIKKIDSEQIKWLKKIEAAN